MKKIIIKNTVLLYVRMVITIFVSFYTSKVIINSLGLVDFGVYTVVFGLIGMLSFLNASLTAAMQRFFSIAIAQKNFSDLNEKFNVSLNIQLLSLIILILVTETLGVWFLDNYLNMPIERKGTAYIVLNLILLSFAFTVIQAPYNALLISHERMHVFAKLSLFEAALKLSLAYLLTVFTYDKLILHCFLMVFFTFLVCMSYVIYCAIHFPETKLKPIFKFNAYGEFINFSSWTVLGGLAVQVRTHGVNIMLNIFFGALVNSAYGILQQIYNVINLFVINFLQAINPQIFKAYANGDLDKTHQIINFGSRITFFLVMILVLPLILLSDSLLKVWLGIYPTYTDKFIQISMFTLLIESMSMPLMAGIQATGKIKAYQLIISMAYLLIIPISGVFLKWGFSPNSVFYLSLAISLIAFFIRLFFITKLTRFDFRNYLLKDVSTAFFTLVVTLAACHLSLNYFSPNESMLDLFYSIILIFISSISSIFILGLSTEERKKITSFVKNILSYKR